MSEKKELKAIKKGNFKDVFGIDVEYFILNDNKKSVVISQREIGRSLNIIGGGGNGIKRFITNKTMSKYIGPEITSKFEKPLIFSGINTGPIKYYGFSIDLLIDICNGILNAKSNNEKLPSLENIAKQAQIIVNACAKSGITNLAYALAGYRPEIHEILEGFKRFLVEEIAREYRKTFPVELYMEWAKIYNFPLRVGKNFNVKCRWLTIDNVYKPFERSNGKIYKMLKDKKTNDIKGKNNRLFQYLNNELGEPKLKEHLTKLLTIAQLADGNREMYENNFAKIFGGQLQFNFETLDEESELTAKTKKQTQENIKNKQEDIDFINNIKQAQLDLPENDKPEDIIAPFTREFKKK